MKKIFTTIAAVCALAAGVSVSQAQPYYLAGHFQGWCNNCTVMTDNGLVGTNGLYGAHQWEYDITGQTPNSYDNSGNGMKVTDGTWANTWPGDNMYVHYDGTGAIKVYFYPGTFTDGWFPAGNRVGYSDTGAPWEVTGTFTTPQFGSDPLAQMTLVAGSAGVYTNIYVITTPGTYQWKCRTTGSWDDLQAGSDFSKSSGNLAFTTTSPNQAVTFTLDLPDGRLAASVPPVFANVQFSVDMTLVVQTDPGFDNTVAHAVTVNGGGLAPNGWGGTDCTNNPTSANPNIYYSPYFNLQVGTSTEYQFRYISSGNTMYDAVGGISGHNRSLTVPNVASTNLPTVYWDDALPTDLLNMDTVVTISVNMTNAVGTDAHVFDPANDGLFINGDFSGWLGWNPITLYGAGLQCHSDGTSLVYTYVTTFPKGHTRALTYKYAINGADNEAPSYQNHFRYIRGTNGVESLPVDTFGVQYNEPKVGGLSIARPAGGAYPVTWLAYPNVHLQTRSSLSSGTWLDVDGTTGASATNWPAGSGPQFFRLVQP
ncbi:MAG: hypothetical protein P4N60_05870 [Verrucomicrobiae bacterium]|nr:hypothetical protein [Verrucomicrobiae bacterium]